MCRGLISCARPWVKVRGGTFRDPGSVYRCGFPASVRSLWLTLSSCRLAFAIGSLCFLAYLGSTAGPFGILLTYAHPLVARLSSGLERGRPLLPAASPCPAVQLRAVHDVVPVDYEHCPGSI